MPRDDLTIDFVRRMPVEAPDPSVILDDWFNRVQNLPEEIRFVQDEILDKDRRYQECLKLIEDRDGKLQKWIKTHGALEPNPKEDALNAQIRGNFVLADQLAAEKIALTQQLTVLVDKQIRSLDVQIKILHDRGDAGFADANELPSLLRPGGANATTPFLRASSSGIGGPGSEGGTTNPSLNQTQTSANSSQARQSSQQARSGQSQQYRQPQYIMAGSAAPMPSGSPMTGSLTGRQSGREGSAGPAVKRGPRANLSLSTVPNMSSGLARHPSLGPGTPKSGVGIGSGSTWAGSAGPRAASFKGPKRAGTPGTGGRKRGPLAAGGTGVKSSLSRLKKGSARNSPLSTAESEVSENDSGSGEDDDESREERAAGRLGTSVDDDEASDDRKYCTCHSISYGNMVACDNDHCPYEWFHWVCVGLKGEPTGKWYCVECEDKMQRKGK